MNKETKLLFESFIGKFPEVELPVVLDDESLFVFNKENDPLPEELIKKVLLPLSREKNPDEFTEYISCFKIPDTYGFHAIVYWRGGLMNYQYLLLTLTLKGELIDKKVICQTQSDGKAIVQSVAQITEDWIIYAAAGKQSVEDSAYDPQQTMIANFELLPDGKISAFDKGKK